MSFAATVSRPVTIRPWKTWSVTSIRALFSQERIQYLDQEGKVIYTAKNKKNKQGFPRRRIKYGVGSGMVGRYVNSLGYVFTSPGKGNSYQTPVSYTHLTLPTN